MSPEELIIATMHYSGKKMYDANKFRQTFIDASAENRLYSIFKPHPAYGTSERLEEAMGILQAGTSMSSFGFNHFIVKEAVLKKYGAEVCEKFPAEGRTQIHRVAYELRKAEITY